jgi:hypothetical protein
VLASVTVLNHDIKNLHMIDYEALGTVRILVGSVIAQTQSAEDGWDVGGIVGDPVEHGAVGTVGHSIEGYLELNGPCRRRILKGVDGDEGKIVDVTVSIDETIVGNGGALGIGNRGSDIYGYVISKRGSREKNY